MEQVRLPNVVSTRGDILKLLREINSLNDFFVGAAARQPGTPVAPPKTTRALDEVASMNKLNLLDENQRKQLEKVLKLVYESAPALHISFAHEPTPRAVEPILVWLREHIHPQCLLSVGLQPSIAAGCVVRTPNKIFDMSLRVHLQKQAHLLNDLIAESLHGK